MCILGGGRNTPTTFDNSMPQIKNPVDTINIMAGELLQHQVRLDADVYHATIVSMGHVVDFVYHVTIVACYH